MKIEIACCNLNNLERASIQPSALDQQKLTMQRFLEEDSKEDPLAFLRNIDNRFSTTKNHRLSKSNNVEKEYYADLIGVGSRFSK